MKIIKLFSGLEFLVENDEAENVAKNYRSKSLIQLRSGDYISTSGIEAITELESIPYWDAYPLNKDGRSFNRDGRRIVLSPEGLEKVKMKLHPKYLVLRKKLLQKTKMLTDQQRVEISEENASHEREVKNT